MGGVLRCRVKGSPIFSYHMQQNQKEYCVDYKKERIRNYEEYQIDTNGIVYKKDGTPMKQTPTKYGYLMVNFSIDGKQKGFMVHRLVASQFIPNNDIEKNQVNHIDGNKKNNHVENLEWVTPYENVRHAIDVLKHDNIGCKNHNAKSVVGVDIKSEEIAYQFDSLADGGRYFASVNESTPKSCKICIWKALTGRMRTYMGCIWKYVDVKDENTNLFECVIT